jgi:hypothetical protein
VKKVDADAGNETEAKKLVVISSDARFFLLQHTKTGKKCTR